MRMVTVAGPPSTGKTSVLVHAIEEMGIAESDIAVVKFDCLVTDDEQAYRRIGVHARSGFSAGQCPDHFYACNIPNAFEWAKSKGAKILITESAGLCNRCSPYIVGVASVCVIDCLAGIGAPRKMGPLLKMADMIVLTKGDMVSQAEREVFAFRVHALSPKAEVVFANGLTGQGSFALARYFEMVADIDSLDKQALRFSTPSALCSYCLGETRLGEAYQMGNARRMEFE